VETRITVQTYAGYKGDERPVSFSREGGTFRVSDIVDRWYDPAHNCFKVLADDRKTYLLRHDTHADCWELLELTGHRRWINWYMSDSLQQGASRRTR
jgi:hypothetical protein